MNNIKRTRELFDVANIPDEIPDKSFGYNRNNVYRCIRYYYENFTDIDIMNYNVGGVTVKTNAVNMDMEISGFKDTRSGYSCYDINTLETLGYDTDELWNGDGIIMYIDDNNVVNIMKSDYYSGRCLSGLLYTESAKALDDVNCDLSNLKKIHFPLRNKILSSKNDFLRANYPSGGASGGIIFGKSDGEWYMLLGVRSEDVSVNQGYHSMVPNGGIEYEEFRGDNMKFLNTTKREFYEEICDEDGFFERFVDSERVFTGWNAKSGTLAAGHALFINNEEKFDSLYENKSPNFEFSDVVKIDVQNKDKITEIVRFDNTSPSVIPTIINGLKLFNNKKSLPTLKYDISSN